MTDGFIIKGTVLVRYEGKESVVEIPVGITTIGDNAFDGNKTLSKVIMPNTVTSIGKFAFRKCDNLRPST